MAVTFNSIPGNLRVPLAYFEINAGYTPTVSPSRLLLLGQMASGASAAPNVPVFIANGAEATFGYTSMLARMVRQARLAAPFQEIWAAPLADAPGSTAATATITVGAMSGQAGTCVVYVGGVRVALNVMAPMTNAQFAVALAAAFNTNFAPIEAVATSAANVVTLTAIAAGAVYNTLLVETGLNADDPLSPAVLAIAQFAGGAGDPDVAMALANLGSDEFDFIAGPYSDVATLNEMQGFLTARWSPFEALYGSYITYKDGTPGALQSAGTLRNDPNVTVYGGTRFSSSAPMISATLGALHADHLQSAPELSRPLQTLMLPGIRGPKALADRQALQTMNSLLYSGVSTLMTAKSGAVMVSRAITTYQTNAYGSADQSFLSVNTRAQLVYGVRYLKAYVTSVWGRAALVDTNSAGLENFATVGDLAASIIHAYRALCMLGVFEHPDLFASLLVVERDATDPNRVNTYLPLDSVNQFVVFAANATSYLELPVAA